METYSKKQLAEIAIRPVMTNKTAESFGDRIIEKLTSNSDKRFMLIFEQSTGLTLRRLLADRFIIDYSSN